MSTRVKWGLITALVYVIYSLISNLTGISQKGGALGFLSNVIIFFVTFFTIFQGIRETRDADHGGFITFGEGFKSGMAMALIAALVSAVFTVVYMKIIDPGYGDKMMSIAEEQWEKAGMSEDQRDMARKWSGFMVNPWLMTLFILCWVIFWGLVKSLIAAAFLKKEAPPHVPTA